MPDRRDDRQRTAENRPGHRFGVKGLQIFQGAAAAGQDDQFGTTSFGNDIKCFHDLGLSGIPLDLHRMDIHLHIWVTTVQDRQQIMDDGTGGRGDQGNLPGQGRQGLLV